MAADPELWPLPSPLPGGADLPWLVQDNRIVGLRWKSDVLRPDSPLFRLGAFPVSADGRPFPLQFRFDPATGAPLRPALPDGALASHPGFLADGFPAILDGLSFRQQPQRERVMVPAGTVAFFTAGAPARIFALTDRGGLFFRDTPGHWSELPTLAPVTWPLHTFGVCAHGRGFATVLADRAVIARVVQGYPALDFDAPRSAGSGVFCGAPAFLPEGVLAFPVRDGATVRLARYDVSAATWMEDLPVGGRLSTEETQFDPPVQSQSQNPDTFWIGARHYLRLSSLYGAWDARVEPLAEGLGFVRGAPVLRDERDTLHAMVQGEEYYALIALSPQGAQTRLDGPCLAAGRGRYFSRYYYPSLSQDEAVTLQIEAGGERVLLPLAYGVNGRGETDGALLVLCQGVGDIRQLFQPKVGQALSGTLYWHGGAQLYPMGVTLTFRSRADILLYRDTTSLCIGSSLTGDFYRIRLT